MSIYRLISFCQLLLFKRYITFVMRCLVVAILFFTTASKVDAANGDYRSIASTNWTTNTTWQADYGSGFVAATAGDYPGKNPGTGLRQIQKNNNTRLSELK